MAALGSIRKRGVTLIVIIGLALFAFIAEEAFRSCEQRATADRAKVGEVLGNKLSYQDYQELVDEMQEYMKISQGRENFTEDELNSIRDQVWGTYVRNKIIENEAEELGLKVTDDELRNVMADGTHQVLRQTPFVNQQTGRFDANLLTNAINVYKNNNTELYNSLMKYRKFLERNLRQTILMQKYQALLASCLVSNEVSAQMAFEASNTENDILLASFPYSAVEDSKVEISDADLKAKYEELKPALLNVTESRDIKYVDYIVTASAADRAALMATMQQACADLKAGGAPDSVVRKAQSIVAYTGIPVTAKAFSRDIKGYVVDSLAVGQTSDVFEIKSDNSYNVVKLISKTQLPDSVEYRVLQVPGSSPEDAAKRADSIYTALQSGTSFDTLAVKFGQTAEKQWLTSAQYENATSFGSDDKEYITALQTMSVGEVRNLKLSGACLILNVTSRTAMTDKYVAAVVKHTINFSNETYSKAYNDFSSFVASCKTIEDMEKEAPKAGYTVKTRERMQNSEHNVAGIASTREAMKWVYGANENELSPLYECGNNDRLMVCALTKIHPVGYLTIEDVKEDLTEMVRNDKKFEKIKAESGAVKSVAEAGQKGAKVDTISQVTFAAPAFIAATGASEPALSGAVAATAAKNFSKAMVKGNNGAYVFEVLRKEARADKKFDEAAKATQMRTLVNQAQQAAGQYMNDLLIKANVVDNRYLF